MESAWILIGADRDLSQISHFYLISESCCNRQRSPGWARIHSQWTAFLGRTKIAQAPEPFIAVQAQIVALVMPPVRALSQSILL